MATTELDKNTLKDVVEKNDIVIVDFWAPWCGPCRSFAPIYETVSAKYPGVVFGKVNTEVETELATAFEIRSIPTLAVFKEQEVIFMQPGMLPEEALEELVQKVKAIDMVELRKQIADEDAKAQKP